MKRVCANRDYDDSVNVGSEHRSARRKRVCGRTRWRRNDCAVAVIGVDKLSVNVHVDKHRARSCAFKHDFVQSRIVQIVTVYFERHSLVEFTVFYRIEYIFDCAIFFKLSQKTEIAAVYSCYDNVVPDVFHGLQNGAVPTENYEIFAILRHVFSAVYYAYAKIVALLYSGNEHILFG